MVSLTSIAIGLAVAGAAPAGALDRAERIVAVKGEGAFPVMIRLDGGTLLAAVRGGASHVGKTGRLDIIRSIDGGRTWSKPIVAVDGPWDDRNPALGQMPDGTVLLAYAEAPHSYRPDGTFDLAAGPYVPFFVTSSDEGRTWSDKHRLPRPWPNVSPFGKIIVCKDGTALMGVYWLGLAGLLRSTDNGKTWGDFSLVHERKGISETQLFELPDARLLALVRMQENRKAGLLLCESNDSGRTWGRTRELMKPNQLPFDLTLLRSGHLLLSYGSRADKFGVGVALSEDAGKTWDEKHSVLLAWDSLSADTGYPSTVALDDGTIVTMYYANGTAASADTQAIVVRYTEEQMRAANRPFSIAEDCGF